MFIMVSAFHSDVWFLSVVAIDIQDLQLSYDLRTGRTAVTHCRQGSRLYFVNISVCVWYVCLKYIAWLFILRGETETFQGKIVPTGICCWWPAIPMSFCHVNMAGLKNQSGEGLSHVGSRVQLLLALICDKHAIWAGLDLFSALQYSIKSKYSINVWHKKWTLQITMGWVFFFFFCWKITL